VLDICRWNVLGRYVKELMADAGLDVREDGMGNIFGRWHGTDPHAGAFQTPLTCVSAGNECARLTAAGKEDGTPDICNTQTDSCGWCAAAVMTGSHADAIPLAGAYDGTLGIIGPIEAVGALNASGYAPRRPIDVVMFTSEEPTRFGLGCIGRSAARV
jgi:ureidoglycolate amidohydrolase